MKVLWFSGWALVLGTLLVAAHATILPAPPLLAQPAPALVTIDSRTVQIRKLDDRWQLVSGNTKLKDLGTSEADANEVLRMVRDLRLTQFGTVGTPLPIIEYWLSSGAAPTGLVGNLRLANIDLDSVRSEEIQSQWCLRDNSRILFNFGRHPEDAGKALQVIRRYQFNRYGFVGQTTPVMMYFLHDSNDRPPIQTSASSMKFSEETPRPAGLLPEKMKSAAPKSAGNPLALMTNKQLNSSGMPMDPRFLGERIAFDYRQARVRREDGVWKLFAGETCLGNFGNNEQRAQDAQRLVEQYRFTEQCRLGPPGRGLTFFLVNGQAPRGVPFGLPSQSFRPETLALRQIGVNWQICDGTQPVLPGSPSEDEAKQMLQTIQRYRFDNLCRLGDGDQGLSFLVRDR